jgi:selenide,water dikinase
MGAIAAQHALSDLYASAAEPLAALALVTLPFAAPPLLERDLEQVLAGALSVFAAADCRLLGGHSMQGPELQVGFAVSGRPLPGGPLRKGGGSAGDQLLLSKPLGTGVLFAAHMQLGADGRDIENAIAHMLAGNGRALEIALAHGATAATDVTGFGLAGHLHEMLDGACGARLYPDAMPLLPGAEAAAAAGYASTLLPANRSAAGAWLRDPPAGPRGELLFDPQTSGGLLLALPPAVWEACLDALVAAGCAAARVGELTAGPGGTICCV